MTISRTAPGDAKAERLAEAIERSSRALNTMTAAKVSDRSRELVRRIEPRARVVRLFQRRVEGAGIGDWGAQLRNHVETLRIEPRTPLPRLMPPCLMIELLAESSSPKELLGTIRRSWPEETLDERLISSEESGRVVFVWQVNDLAPAEFESLRRQAKEELARRRVRQPSDETSLPSQTKELTVPQWNVMLRPADADILAEKGLLSGIEVAKVFDDGSKVGLQKGDVIIDYSRIYDAATGFHGPFGSARRISQKARYGGELDVIRGNRMVTLKAPRRR